MTINDLAPLIFPIDYDGLNKYKNNWKQIVAQVTDSHGNVWKSKLVNDKPSWAD